MSRIRWRWAGGMLMNDGLQNGRVAEQHRVLKNEEQCVLL